MDDYADQAIRGVPDFGATIGALKRLVEEPPDTAHDLNAMLGDIHQAFANTEFEAFDPVELRVSAPEMIKSIFNLRMRLRDHISGWNAGWKLSHNGQKALRDVFRVTRYATDMLGETAIGLEMLGEHQETNRAFEAGAPHTLVNSTFDQSSGFKFQSGDILLVRGRAHNSAAIARIGDIDSQFSHLGMIYIDETRRAWLVQALIEYGAVLTPLEEALQYGLVRAVLFRHKDQNLAKQAAYLIHDRVDRSQSDGGEPILYDFSMELEGYDRLFCSKLARQAFDEASSGEVRLPTFTTRLNMKNRDFLDRIGVTAEETFAPGDMEIEPQFDVVAEWRDYRATATVRLQDLVMDKLFAWMDDYGFRFQEDSAIWLMSKLGRGSSYLSLKVKRMLAEVMPIVPPNMTRETVAAVAMLHFTAQPLLEQLLALQKEQNQATNRPIHPKLVLDELERLREDAGSKIGYLTL